MLVQTKVEVTQSVDITDIIKCDHCSTVLHMNMDILDRRTRYKPEQIVKVKRYFKMSNYTPPEPESIHLCPICMKAELNKWFDLDEPEIEWDVESKSGEYIPEELKAREQAKEEAKRRAQRMAEIAKAKEIQSIEDGTHPVIQAEEEMLQGFMKHEGSD